MSIAATVLGVSTAFPVAASLWPGDHVPRWPGLLDVALALAAVALGVRVVATAPKRADDRAVRIAGRIYRGLVTVPLAQVALFLAAGDRIKWSVLLPGLGWRAWLLMYALPAAIALLGPQAVEAGVPAAAGEASTGRAL